MSNFKIVKMDRRHTGHELFKHYINYNVYVRSGRQSAAHSMSTNELNFLRARVWFWEKFGPSGELGKTSQAKMINDPLEWAWQSDHNLLRIYVTEEALAFFMLAQSA